VGDARLAWISGSAKGRAMLDSNRAPLQRGRCVLAQEKPMFCRRLAILAVAVAVLAVPASTGLLATNAFAQGTVQTQPIDPFGQEVVMPEKTIVYASGTAEWDTAYDTLTEAFKTIQAFLDKRGLKAIGPAMTIYTAMDDTTFNFQAAVPIAEAPKGPPQDNVSSGRSPGGKALKFVHRGSFEGLTATYDAISHFVEEKQFSSKELLIEEYVTDFLSTPADKLVINIFVPLN
jgi:effector-binding domain-containing protein